MSFGRGDGANAPAGQAFIGRGDADSDSVGQFSFDRQRVLLPGGAIVGVSAADKPAQRHR
jgi:hypothetical protein